MKLFASKLDRAVAACAKTLPTRLARDYGASEFYTEAQITRALAALKTPPQAAAFAYAMYLPEDLYLKLAPERQALAGQESARLAFTAHFPVSPTAPGHFYQSEADLAQISSLLPNP